MTKKRPLLLALLLTLGILLAGCAGDAENTREGEGVTLDPNASQAQGEKPGIPEKLALNDQGIPLLQVYLVDEEKNEEMDLESYLQGVLAGEMKNDWPLEALKAQAILARTFVLKFNAEKQSKYPGADISTDIEEAQAYDATGVNERIEQAVNGTRGMVLSYEGTLPYAWFHAHSGGVTARAKEGLAYEKDEPGYTKAVAGKESGDAPAEAREWSASFPAKAVMEAGKKVGLSANEGLETITVGERGESGRAVTILINGQSISAPELRIALGSTHMRSTLLTSLRLENGRVAMAGKGYGHGVGMPQWGAYALAQSGQTAEEIVTYYFQDVTVEKLW